MAKYSIENNGLCLFSSDSVIECFEYFKSNIESMPKAYKFCNLVINDVPSAPISVDDKNIHIYIHIGGM